MSREQVRVGLALDRTGQLRTRVCDSTVADRIPFGPTSFRVTYLTAIEQISELEMHAYAWPNPRGGFNPFAESRKFKRAPSCTNRFRLMPHGIGRVTPLKRPRVLTRKRSRSCTSLEATRESGGPSE